MKHEDVLLHYVEMPNGCWEWTGDKSPKGYGHVSVLRNGKRTSTRPHRVSYELLKGPIPEGLVLDHLCRNRICINPDHLEPVTNRENLLRGDTLPARNVAKTHCAHGHEYSEQNTRYETRANGSVQRSCVICRRAKDKRINERRKAQRAAEVAA